MKTPPITLEQANEFFSYNPDTGEFFWKVARGKSKVGKPVGTLCNGYAICTIFRKNLKLHRLAWFMTNGSWPNGQIDHIDGNKLNNRISNLRDVSMSVNMQNRYESRRKKDDLPRGVRKNPSGNYEANIRIGIYATPEDAHKAYLTAKSLIHAGCSHIKPLL